jgi:hypothetical protein
MLLSVPQQNRDNDLYNDLSTRFRGSDVKVNDICCSYCHSVDHDCIGEEMAQLYEDLTTASCAAECGRTEGCTATRFQEPSQCALFRGSVTRVIDSSAGFTCTLMSELPPSPTFGPTKSPTLAPTSASGVGPLIAACPVFAEYAAAAFNSQRNPTGQEFLAICAEGGSGRNSSSSACAAAVAQNTNTDIASLYNACQNTGTNASIASACPAFGSYVNATGCTGEGADGGCSRLPTSSEIGAVRGVVGGRGRQRVLLGGADDARERAEADGVRPVRGGVQRCGS